VCYSQGLKVNLTYVAHVNDSCSNYIVQLPDPVAEKLVTLLGFPHSPQPERTLKAGKPEKGSLLQKK
jgi:hypothetical protein